MTQDSNTILQGQLKQKGLYTTRPQFTNILYGTVVQTDVSIAPLLPEGAASPIPPGMMTVSVPTLGTNYVTQPILYPSGITPPVGSVASIGFTPNGTPICLTLYTFGVGGVLPIVNGGTGASTAAQALINLGAASEINLLAEVSRATTAEGVLTTNLAAEVSRAEGAEGVLTAAEFFITNMIIMGAYY